MDNCYDLIIVGSGPAGLSAAYAAKQHGLDYIVLERDQIALLPRSLHTQLLV